MLAVDWIFLFGLLVSLGIGIWRGFVYEVMSVLNWLLAFVLAQWLGENVGSLFPFGGNTETLGHVVGFVLVFVLSVFLGGALVWGISRLVEKAGLRPVDRGLGGVFGVLRALIVGLALTVLVQMTAIKHQDWWRDSLLADTALWTLKRLKPVLPPGVGKYLP